MYITFYCTLWKLSIVNFVDCNLFGDQWKQRKRVRGHGFYKKHECCYNVDFTRGRKALCDTRCNTFLRSVLLCAYTDYYDHCDYYDDGNFFHNSPLLHSLVSTMQLWCYYIINTIVWLSPYLRSCLRWYTFTHVYTYTCNTPQINAVDTPKQDVQHQQHQCSTHLRRKRFSSCCSLMLFTLETLSRLSSTLIDQGNWLINHHRLYWIVIIIY